MEGLGDPRRQGVPEDAEPEGAVVTDDGGAVEIAGDYLGRSDPRAKRSLWLLVEVEHEGEVRFDVVRLLDLNEAWIAGHRDRYEHALSWGALRRR
jgi:hypothetical protein